MNTVRPKKCVWPGFQDQPLSALSLFLARCVGSLLLQCIVYVQCHPDPRLYEGVPWIFCIKKRRNHMYMGHSQNLWSTFVTRKRKSEKFQTIAESIKNNSRIHAHVKVYYILCVSQFFFHFIFILNLHKLRKLLKCAL